MIVDLRFVFSHAYIHIKIGPAVATIAAIPMTTGQPFLVKPFLDVFNANSYSSYLLSKTDLAVIVQR